MFAWLVLTEQKLESRLSQYRAYLPRNPSYSKIPEASALRGDEMILLCAAYTIRIQSPCELSSIAGWNIPDYPIPPTSSSFQEDSATQT